MIAPRESGAHNIVDVTYSQFWNIRSYLDRATTRQAGAWTCVHRPSLMLAFTRLARYCLRSDDSRRRISPTIFRTGGGFQEEKCMLRTGTF